MHLLLFAITTWGITNIIVTSDLFHPIRKFAERRLGPVGTLFNCFMCTSFWVGVGVSLALVGPALHYTYNGMTYPAWVTARSHAAFWLGAVMDGFIASGFSWALYIFLATRHNGEDDHE